MTNNKSRMVAAGSVFTLVAAAVGISIIGGGAADAQEAANTVPTAFVAANTVNSTSIVNGGIYQADINTGVVNVLRTPGKDSVTGWTVKDGTVIEADLSTAVKAKLNKTAPTYLEHWGTIHRNVIGAADASLDDTSTQAPLGRGALNVHTTSATDKVAWGNEVDFKDKLVKDLGTIGFSVYTTGENNALGNNMPAIIFEIDPNVTAVDADYSSLVYLPANGKSNEWTTFNATTDEGKTWGLSGTKFNGTPCSINGSRCTFAEVLAYLNDGGDAAKVLTASISKGRDYAFSGAVDAFKVDGKTYDFEKNGVKVS
jgi:hypothetical protein